MRSLWMTRRLASLLFYGLSLLIIHHAQPMAAKAYNDLCSSQGTTFGEGLSVNFLGVMLIIVALSLFLARSNALVLTNLIAGLITICGAGSLLSTASNTPYECFTQAGTYEDHTSGLDGFEMWLVFATLLSYVLLVVDLAIWSVRKLTYCDAAFHLEEGGRACPRTSR
jgi:hypothetical protein